ncbi:PP2C family protein-serine/threonine phosphatase [Nonomuraea rubra]|uniref:PP2C family protein-serine/threonine phosphatase n=1 Tax=Nonomuraea rubra TaxID=46180 RepID=UPI003CD0BBBB
MCRQRLNTRFLTAACLTFEPHPDGSVRGLISLGGHAPALIRRADGTVQEAGLPGDLLGMFDDLSLHTEIVDLAPGDAVLLYTDGVTEAHRRGDHASWGEPALAALLAGCGGLNADRILIASPRPYRACAGNYRSDGHRRACLLRVPPSMRSDYEAIAARHGLADRACTDLSAQHRPAPARRLQRSPPRPLQHPAPQLQDSLTGPATPRRASRRITAAARGDGLAAAPDRHRPRAAPRRTGSRHICSDTPARCRPPRGSRDRTARRPHSDPWSPVGSGVWFPCSARGLMWADSLARVFQDAPEASVGRVSAVGCLEGWETCCADVSRWVCPAAAELRPSSRPDTCRWIPAVTRVRTVVGSSASSYRQRRSSSSWKHRPWSFFHRGRMRPAKHAVTVQPLTAFSRGGRAAARSQPVVSARLCTGASTRTAITVCGASAPGPRSHGDWQGSREAPPG